MNTHSKVPVGLPHTSLFINVERHSQYERAVLFSLPNSTITVARTPASELTTSKYLRSVDRAGIYAFVSHPADPNYDSSVYVGSSGNIARRLKEHRHDARHANAQFIFTITSSSMDVSSAHARRGEGILRRLSAQQPRVDVISEDVPPFAMGRRDQAVMTVLVQTMCELLAAAGYPLHDASELIFDEVDFLHKAENLEEVTKKTASTPLPVANEAAATRDALGQLDRTLWEFNAPRGCLSDYRLYGAMTTNDTFVLFPGSEFRVRQDHNLPPSIEAARSRLLESGTLEATGEEDGRLILTYPLEVASPAIAIYVMLKARRDTAGSDWVKVPVGSKAKAAEAKAA